MNQPTVDPPAQIIVSTRCWLTPRLIVTGAASGSQSLTAMCMFRALPPMNVSSTSTSQPSLPNPPYRSMSRFSEVE
jgi:hypothetical protein